MPRKREPEIVLSQPDTEQVDSLLANYTLIAQALHTSTKQSEAEAALHTIHQLPELAQIAFLKSLAREKRSEAADIAVALNALSPLKEVRKEARRTLLHLEGGKIYAQWRAPIQQSSAIQVAVSNPPRFWKGQVTQSRDQGEVQLMLIWEQGYGYNETRTLSFLLEFWRDGIKNCSVELISKRKIQERIEESRKALTDIALLDCSLAEGKRLLDEALEVNQWRKTEPHKDYRLNLSLITNLLQKESESAEDAGRTFIHPELTDEEVVLDFIGSWSLGDFGLAYDLLSKRSMVHENLERAEWIARRRAWTDEAKPARLELGFVQSQEANQSSGIWLPSSNTRTNQRKEVHIGWSLELTDTPLSGTLKEFPLGSAVNKVTQRHWFWTSTLVVREDGEWRIQSITDQAANAQGMQIADLQQQVSTLEKLVEETVQQRATLAPDMYVSRLSKGLTEQLHYDDALIARLPLDKKAYEDGYKHSLSAGNPERALVYLEKLEERFPDPTGETLRNTGATMVNLAYTERTFPLEERRNQLLVRAEALLRQSIERNDDAPGHLLLAELLVSLGRNDDAEVELQRGKELHPSVAIEAPIETALGTIAIRRERMEEALTHFQRVGELAPEYPGNWFNLGFALRQLGHLDKAAESYTRAVQAEPQDDRPYAELIAIAMNQGNKQRAQAIAEQGVQANPGSARLHALLSSVLSQMGEQRAARRELQVAEELDPTEPVVIEMRRLLTAAAKR